MKLTNAAQEKLLVASAEGAYAKAFACGKEVFVTPHLVGFTGDHPSNVDYYYSERGYNCTTEEEVADQYHRNFCQECNTDALAEAAILDAAIAYNEAMAQNEPTSQVEDSRDAAEVVG